MFKKFFKNEKGLTLVELLAVIVILGIVAAIAVPSIGSVIQKSRENAVKADALAVLNGAKTYVAEHGAPADTATGTTNITKADLVDYVDDVKLGDDDDAAAYSVSVSTNGKTFTLNTVAVPVGKIKITFTDAEISEINNDKDYGNTRTIGTTQSSNEDEEEQG